jgi:hypothetical protein
MEGVTVVSAKLKELTALSGFLASGDPYDAVIDNNSKEVAEAATISEAVKVRDLIDLLHITSSSTAATSSLAHKCCGDVLQISACSSVPEVVIVHDKCCRLSLGSVTENNVAMIAIDAAATTAAASETATFSTVAVLIQHSSYNYSDKSILVT